MFLRNSPTWRRPGSLLSVVVRLADGVFVIDEDIVLSRLLFSLQKAPVRTGKWLPLREYGVSRASPVGRSQYTLDVGPIHQAGQLQGPWERIQPGPNKPALVAL